MKASRRRLLAATVFAGGAATCSPRPAEWVRDAAVAILKARSYSADLEDVILRGVEACGLQVRGLRVLLKPNLVEFDAHAPVSTHVAVVAAALAVFRNLGAATVEIGEGPGHRRDALAVAEQARYREAIPGFERLFTDLNRDDVDVVCRFGDEERIWLPKTALGADLIVSIPKMKTHHWAGATLAMKNLFGLVPGAIYGWPKNFLHYQGIDRSVLELNRIFRRTFAIVDGITGMEGNGPIQGTAVDAGVLVFGGDLVAVDATCCRLMGIAPERVGYLARARAIGQLEAARITQLGESVAAVRRPFGLIGELASLRA
jgi:uncharacterized protein (DUF362 family)